MLYASKLVFSSAIIFFSYLTLRYSIAKTAVMICKHKAAGPIIIYKVWILAKELIAHVTLIIILHGLRYLVEDKWYIDQA